MNTGTFSKKTSEMAGVTLVVLLALVSLRSLVDLGPDIHQGQVYRILFIHVPSAISAFFCALVLFGMSAYSLIKRTSKTLFYAKACAEIGLLFTCLTLFTGSVWGKPTWGVYWTWDARLTTTLLLSILYAAYLFMWSSIDDPLQKSKSCGVLGIIIFLDIPIIYKSVTWWRTLHQGYSVTLQGEENMSSVISEQLWISMALTLGFCLWLILYRGRNLTLLKDMEDTLLEGGK